MALLISPYPAALDSYEERKLFNAREIAKSASTSVNAILYFRSQFDLSSSAVSKEKLALITSGVQIYGKDFPEIFFFGVDTLRMGYRKGDELVSPAAIEAAIQFCINAVNWFKSRQDNDLLLVAGFDLLFTLLSSSKITLAAIVSRESMETLGSCLSREFMMKVSARSGGYILSTFGLLELVHPVGIFLKQDLVSFCLDFLSGAKDLEEDEGNAILFQGCVLYCIASLRSTFLPRRFLAEVFLRDAKHLVACISRLAPNLNARQNLMDLIICIGANLRSGLMLQDEALVAKPSMSPSGADGWNAWSGLGGMLGADSSPEEFPIEEKLPKIFDSVDVDAIDDIFGAYTSDAPSDARDTDIVLGICSIGVALVKYYARRSAMSISSTRKALVLSVGRKWILTAMMSVDPIIVSSGLGLGAELFTATTEPVNSLISSQSFDQTVETMQSKKSGNFAAQQAAAFIMKVPGGSEFAQIFFARFFFHPQVFLCEVLKIQFFKSFGMKEIFLRVVSVIHEIRDPEEQTEVVRVAVQMVQAMKAKALMEGVRSEIVAIESERWKSDPSKPGFLAWMVVALAVAAARDDSVTCEGIIYLIFETFFAQLGSNSALVPKILEIIRGGLRSAAQDILAGGKPAALDQKRTGSPISPPRSVLDVFASVNMIPAKPVKKKVTPAVSPDSPESQEGWADTAAGWFLDLEPVEETPEKKKKSKPPPLPEPVDSEPVSPTSPPPVVKQIAPTPPIVFKKSSGLPAPKTIVPGSKPIQKVPGNVPPGTKFIQKVPGNAKPVKPASKMMPPKPTSVKPVSGGLNLSPPPKKVTQPLPTKVPPSKPAPKPPAVKPSTPPPEDPPKKPKKEPTQPPEPGWGEYIGGLWGAAEPPKEKKKKKKKTDEDAEEP